MIAIVQEHVATSRIPIPELFPAAVRCTELLRENRLGFQEAATILNGAPALRSRVMKLANSAAFPSLMPATTVELAVARLGSQGLVGALIEFAAHETLEGKDLRIKDMLRRIWPYAVGCAVMTSDVCQQIGSPADLPTAYLAGLMSSVGKPLVGHLLVDVDRQMQRSGNRSGVPDPVIRAVMDACHAVAGAALCRHWELPTAVALAVERQSAWNPDEPTSLSNVVRFSAAYVCRLGLTVGSGNVADVDRLLGEGRPLLRLDDGALRRISHGFKERVAVLSQLRG